MRDWRWRHSDCVNVNCVRRAEIDRFHRSQPRPESGEPFSPPDCGALSRRVGSVRRRIGMRAVASEQLLQLGDLSWLDQIGIETCGEARVADVRAGIATEGDQVELGRRKPLAETTTQLYPVHPRH